MKPSISKQDRISARVPQEVYETLVLSADLTGATVNHTWCNRRSKKPSR